MQLAAPLLVSLCIPAPWAGRLVHLTNWMRVRFNANVPNVPTDLCILRRVSGRLVHLALWLRAPSKSKVTRNATKLTCANRAACTSRRPIFSGDLHKSIYCIFSLKKSDCTSGFSPAENCCQLVRAARVGPRFVHWLRKLFCLRPCFTHKWNCYNSQELLLGIIIVAVMIPRGLR